LAMSAVEAARNASEEAQEQRDRYVASAVACLAGLALTIVFFMHDRHDHARSIQADFQSQAQTNYQAGLERIDYLQEVVYSLRRTFLTQQIVDRKEFQVLANDLLARNEGIQSLQWVEVVPDARRTEVEAELSAAAGHPVSIRQLSPDGSLQTADLRDHYWVIRYAEPLASNASVLGYDVATAPSRLALQTAARTNSFNASPLFRLAQSEPDQSAPGVIFMMPVFSPTTAEGPLRGFVQAVMRSDRLLEPAHRNRDNAIWYRYLDVTGDDQPDGFVGKPFTATDLLRAIERIYRSA